MNVFFRAVCCSSTALLLVGCVQAPLPTAARRGETPIEQPKTDSEIHGVIGISYGSGGEWLD